MENMQYSRLFDFSYVAEKRPLFLATGVRADISRASEAKRFFIFRNRKFFAKYYFCKRAIASELPWRKVSV